MDEFALTAIKIVYILVIILMVVIFLFVLKGRYSKLCKNYLLCEFWPIDGNVFSKWIPIVNGMITLEKKIKGRKYSRTYSIAQVGTGKINYPPVPWWLSIVQSSASKAIFDEETWEPISNRRGKLLLPPRRLFSIVNERFSELGVANAKAEIESRKSVVSQSFFSKWGWLIILGIIALAAAGGYYYIMNYQETLKAGLGIG